MNKMKKKYFISLAYQVPVNLEGYVYAESEDQALEMIESGECDPTAFSFGEEDYSEAQQDYQNVSGKYSDAVGVHIEEA